ncbi:MAG: S6e family ribosomal protein [Thermoproteota archaeon]
MPVRIRIEIEDHVEKKHESLILEGEDAKPLMGYKIGDVIDGAIIKKQGKFKITGGSDTSGFPMLVGIHGTAQRSVLLERGKAARKAKKGEKVKVTVRGEVVSEETAQVNLVRIE